MTGTMTEVETTVEVVQRVRAADGVVRLVLRNPEGEMFPPWEPGAHVDLVLGEGMIRQYSLCGNPADRHTYEVAVLREPDGRGGSAFVHDRLEAGATIRLRGPRNHFPLVPAARYRFVAGGIGITPILPMLRALGPSADWTLLYGGRTRRSMAFADELQDRYPGRVAICPQDETGLLDLDRALADPDLGTVVYCCGPGPLLDAVTARCTHWPEGTLHVERFAPAEQVDRPATAFVVECERSGMTLPVPPDRRIVDVLDEAGIDVDVSCEEGICGTCETAVLDGVPEHRDSIQTEADRRRNDTIFVCVSRSCSPRLRLDL
ncbi:oxidoreductase [Pseudonocardia sp. C8]|uniref:PDR/VanB family oxidoreductase n=1 Tax=Pseudonocardia sp. C8 TaxID=2762759 RepID=UPI0016426A72|nr:PDR/VanB family oxidoreductase [Pseudonocardia sp. C8]MBC3191788.1 oxidoreductase [Pseudonocardia sp. C8]